ncbi:F-box/kelch-repeat protein At3g23880-like [Vigna unguiculata]|uniref:F-box protein 22 n=1 Tax=Vigna unguiculata TaxID=3917 RepID=A0A4D6KZU9_VIGUN|nr:F-box/kelch-repeat protein At3g23880-like [Vigna unguiculata]QCD79894.1 F-box protein 22 [Vigna unguiculata]
MTWSLRKSTEEGKGLGSVLEKEQLCPVLLSSLYIESYAACRTMKESKMKRTNRRGVRRRRTTVLPWALIIQILLRLPVKSLVRFKSVCRSWFSLISDPNFAISHFELAAASTERLLLLESIVPEARSIDFNAPLHDDSASATLNLNSLQPEFYWDQILGSCRGFVLLDCGQSLCLWNPSTGIHKQVCHSPIAWNMDVMFCTFLYGFGYDPSTDDYLVVQASYDVNSEAVTTRVEFFSVRANAWKEIEGIHLSYMNCCDDPRTGSLLNGAIHWLAYSNDASRNVIVVFDLTERSFSEILLPEDLACQFDFCELRVLGDFLCVHVMGYHECPLQIWVMKEYKIHSSWTRSVDVPVDEIPTKCFSLICATKNGDIVGRTDGDSGLVKCNNEGEFLEHRSYYDGRRGSQMIVYTESLLSLPYDSDQAEED